MIRKHYIRSKQWIVWSNLSFRAIFQNGLQYGALWKNW